MQSQEEKKTARKSKSSNFHKVVYRPHSVTRKFLILSDFSSVLELKKTEAKSETWSLAKSRYELTSNCSTEGKAISRVESSIKEILFSTLLSLLQGETPVKDVTVSIQLGKLFLYSRGKT
jgi:hypothetical protein